MPDDERGNPWTVQARRTVYDNPWIEVIEHDVLNPAGNPGIYGVVHVKGLAVGLSVTRDMTALGNTRSVRFRTELEREGFDETDGGVARDTANEVRGGLPADQQAIIEPG